TRRPRLKQSKEVRRAKRKARKAAAEAAASVQPEVKVVTKATGKGRIEKPYVARCAEPQLDERPNRAGRAGRTAIVLRRATNKIFVIYMDSDGLCVKGDSIDKFDAHFAPYVYDVQKAAQSFLDWGNAYLGITDVARDALL